ncbi:hypothetical protein GDO78_016562 [Eleutherodactylus coqui]|uniref:Uncharacterized protein n=1 Tax=Eleutherodactylus coqui TaxID=57060 RepID=A0A8J6BER3_ELECQ|nr:hypothetical protein GDO78_016562 [Eleutherodactylus coqui]
MATADLRDELRCSICLSTFTDPVTLRCGHNFCRVCMDEFLKTQNGAGVYSCPECRAVFLERPVLQRNVTLHNVAERILSSQPHQEEITGIRCTYCIHSPVPAVKSCLHCEASLCDNHLRVHSKAAEHVLTEPSANLEDRKCSVHKKILEYYCTEDDACICVYCSAGHHRGHRVEMLDEASKKKKEKMRTVLQKLTTKREKIEERVRSLEQCWREDQEKASGEVERVTALFIDIRRRLNDLENRVLREISRQEELMSLSLSDVIQKLEVKKDELSRKMRHMEELCNMTDPWTVLQEPDTGDLCDPEEEGGEEDTGEHVDGITGMLQTDDMKTATWKNVEQNRPETSERFQEYPQVMSSRGFTSGRHYWDVEVGGSGWWRVGMCYRSIDRRGDQSYIGCNKKSWGLCGGLIYNYQYSVRHDSKQIRLYHQISGDRFRICLDYEAGRLSFYNLCDPIRHLHTFTAAFTEPLHAVLYVCGGYIKV